MLHLQVPWLAAVLFRIIALSPPTFHFVSTRYVLLKNAGLSSRVLILMRRVSSATNKRLGCDPVLYFVIVTRFHEARGGIMVKALRYKPAGRRFNSRWCH